MLGLSDLGLKGGLSIESRLLGFCGPRFSRSVLDKVAVRKDSVSIRFGAWDSGKDGQKRALLRTDVPSESRVNYTLHPPSCHKSLSSPHSNISCLHTMHQPQNNLNNLLTLS